MREARTRESDNKTTRPEPGHKTKAGNPSVATGWAKQTPHLPPHHCPHTTPKNSLTMLNIGWVVVHPGLPVACCCTHHSPTHIRTGYTNLLFWGCVLLLFMVLLLLWVGLGVCVRVGCVCGVGSGCRCVASCHANVWSPLCKATVIGRRQPARYTNACRHRAWASAFWRWVSVV